MPVFTQTTVGTYNYTALQELVRLDMIAKGFGDAVVTSNTPDVVITGTVSAVVTPEE